MLIRFTIENFLSFKERIEFSMLPGKGRLHPHHVTDIGDQDRIPVLRSALIYGANASGKSNLIKALAFGQRLVRRGTIDDQESLNFKHFRLDIASRSLPSRIEYEFIQDGKSYAYGFVFDATSIHEEWLYEIHKTRKDRKIFERKLEENGKSTYLLDGMRFANADERQFLEFTAKGTRRNQLFLAECRSRNVHDNISDFTDIGNALDWFYFGLKIVHPSTRLEPVEFILESSDILRGAFDSMLSYFQTGIHGLELKEIDVEQSGIPDKVIREFLRIPSRRQATVRGREGSYFALERDGDQVTKILKMTAKHKVAGSDEIEYFEIPEESDGTQRILDLIPRLFDAVVMPCAVFIDEIDNSLHPNLVYDFLEFFLNSTPAAKGQIIATTHESRLLSQKLLRKDEIWLVDKDASGASTLSSLNEFKVRFDKEIRSDYLLGRYGGVPRFGSRASISTVVASI
jgi:AAA15 family ATPase/GTPase